MFLQGLLTFFLILSALGVILAKKPVWSGLSFLITLVLISAVYLQLAAHFIAAMQVLVYAGAILVIFMFVIVLFQDAYQKIEQMDSKNSRLALIAAACIFLVAAGWVGTRLIQFAPHQELPKDYGTVEVLGRVLFIDFFFPFEAVIVLFLVAVVGAVFIGRMEKET